jgi:hypothetical protein
MRVMPEPCTYRNALRWQHTVLLLLVPTATSPFARGAPCDDEARVIQVRTPRADRGTRPRNDHPWVAVVVSIRTAFVWLVPPDLSAEPRCRRSPLRHQRRRNAPPTFVRPGTSVARFRFTDVDGGSPRVTRTPALAFPVGAFRCLARDIGGVRRDVECGQTGSAVGVDDEIGERVQCRCGVRSVEPPQNGRIRVRTRLWVPVRTPTRRETRHRATDRIDHTSTHSTNPGGISDDGCCPVRAGPIGCRRLRKVSRWEAAGPVRWDGRRRRRFRSEHRGEAAAIVVCAFWTSGKGR